MIHTVTVNPALDLTYRVPKVKIDDKIRASTVYRAAGGNGINVSRVAARLGHPTVAMGFAGGRTGDELIEHLSLEKVRTWFTRQTAPTRTNTIIQDDEGKQIRISSPGASVTESEVAALESSIFDLRAPDFLVITGSLLKGMPDNFYLRVIKTAVDQRIKVVADVDRELSELVDAGVYFIKPNHFELERLTGHSIKTYDDAVSASRSALARGVQGVICSMGSKGAVLVTESEAWKAVPPVIEVDSAVGAGDSLLAGALVAMAEGKPWQDVLRQGVACGTATATTPGTDLCYANTIEEILPKVGLEKIGI